MKKIDEGIKNHIIKLKRVDKATNNEIIQIVANTYEGLKISNSGIYNILSPRKSTYIPKKKKDNLPEKRKYNKRTPATLADPKDTVKLISEIETLIQDLHETYVQRLMSIRGQLIKAIAELRETGKK